MRFSASLVLTACIFFSHSVAHAQILPREDQQADAGLEDLYDKYETEENRQRKNRDEVEKPKSDLDDKKPEEANRLSELSTLSPFQDIAVIQKRFLPKTFRLEMSGSGVFSTNNAYFNNFGAGLRLAFYFHEKYGIEGTYQMVSSSQRPITEGLVDNQKIKTEALVEPESYYGVAFKWVPVYGKMAWFQEKIIPFDLYFTPGFGMSTTVNGGSESTMSLGVGQLFALSKSLGVRWDFVWNYYEAGVDITTNGVTTNEKQNHSDLFLGIGISYFIPEATYR